MKNTTEITFNEIKSTACSKMITHSSSNQGNYFGAQRILLQYCYVHSTSITPIYAELPLKEGKYFLNDSKIFLIIKVYQIFTNIT